MNVSKSWKQPTWLAALTAVSLINIAAAQTPSAPAEDKAENKDKAVKLEKYVVTGSSIKRAADEGALPMDVFTPAELESKGITSAEQMIMSMNINGNSIDNMASNTDVVSSGTSRGYNGASAANLRDQGSNATLVLLNGRRVAQHGLNGGGVVDLNSIPFLALKRVEVLKDGASSIYGTEAIGGVINFILRDDYQGAQISSGFDDTQAGGGNQYRYSIIAGFGDLNKDKFNIMAAASVTDNKILLGSQRPWLNTQQPDRGLAPDTRGTPFATINAISTLQNVLSRGNTSTTRGGFIDPSTGLTVSTVNTLILSDPGKAATVGMYPYDWQLWSTAGAKYGAAVDTGVMAALQQPVKNSNFVLSGVYKLGQHRLSVEGVFGRSDSTKWFSSSQLTSSTSATTTNPSGGVVANPLYNLAYPSTGADYNNVFNTLIQYFPQLAVNRGLPIPMRWRFYPAGDRRYSTHSDTSRLLASAEGPLPFFRDWEYRAGIAQAVSKSNSTLQGGYYYTQGIANLINTGVLDPFSLTQTDAAMTALQQYSANGVQLYGGKFTTNSLDVTFSGPIVQLASGQLQAAVGYNHFEDKYGLNGQTDPKFLTVDGLIANAPFDNANQTSGTLKRTVNALFTELDIPVMRGVDFNPSVRRDDYSGFGATTNPKYTLRISPADWLVIRGSYSTGFRVPTFSQEYFPTTISPATSQIADPVSGAQLNSYNVWTGGKLTLKPETARMQSAGFVVNPTKHFSFSADWWTIDRQNTITTLGVTQILANYKLFPDRLIRDSAGNLTAIDNTWVNAGESITSGVELQARGNMNIAGGTLDVSFDITDLLQKKSRLIASAPFGSSEVGHFPKGTYGELGLKYKATTNVSYRRGNWTVAVTELYRSGYMDQPIGNLSSGFSPSGWNPKVDAYNLYNLTVSYKGLIKNLTITAGIKNLFNNNPPFVHYYDTNSGAGSDWDPRVADPRGRSFVLSGEYKIW